MYDEDALYNELKTTFKSTAQTAQTAMSLIEQLNRLNEHTFTGQSTDLNYFTQNNTMPISMIENIPDEPLKYAVKDEFNKAALSGKIEIDNQNGIISITEKGKEFISRPEFKRAAAENLANMKMQQSQTMGFALNGTVQDLNFFNYADELNLADVVASPNKEAVQNVLSNLQKMKESGLISISDSVVKITDKGRNILNSDLFKLASKGAVNGAVDKAAAAAGSVPGAVVVAVKKAAETAVKLVQK